MIAYIGPAITIILSLLAIAATWGKINQKLESNLKKLDDIQREFEKKQESQNTKLDKIIDAHSEFKSQMVRVETDQANLKSSQLSESTVNAAKFSELRTRIEGFEIKFSEELRRIENRHSEEIKQARHIANEAKNAVTVLQQAIEFLKPNTRKR